MMTKWKTEKQANTIGEGVYFTLRKNILDMKLKPGSKISIKELAELFEVSRSPVRDAIIRLESEGLVDSIPQVGTTISCINLKKVEEERFLRECLEEKIMLLFADSYKQDHIDRLKEIFTVMKKANVQGDYIEAIYADDAFHALFFEAVDKKQCLEIMQATGGHFRRIRLLSIFDSEIKEHVMEQHSRLIDLIENGDKKGLILETTAHCRNIISEQKLLLEKYPEYFQTENDKTNELKNDFLSSFK